MQSFLEQPDPAPMPVWTQDGARLWGDMRRRDVEPRLPSYVAALGLYPETRAVITLKAPVSIRPGETVKYGDEPVHVLAVFDPYDISPATGHIEDQTRRRALRGQMDRQRGKWVKLLVRGL